MAIVRARAAGAWLVAALTSLAACVDLGALQGPQDGGSPDGETPDGTAHDGRAIDGPLDSEGQADAGAGCGVEILPPPSVSGGVIVARDEAAPGGPSALTMVPAHDAIYWLEGGVQLHYTSKFSKAGSAAIGTCVSALPTAAPPHPMTSLYAGSSTGGNRLVAFAPNSSAADCCTYVVDLGTDAAAECGVTGNCIGWGTDGTTDIFGIRGTPNDSVELAPFAAIQPVTPTLVKGYSGSPPLLTTMAAGTDLAFFAVAGTGSAGTGNEIYEVSFTNPNVALLAATAAKIAMMAHVSTDLVYVLENGEIYSVPTSNPPPQTPVLLGSLQPTDVPGLSSIALSGTEVFFAMATQIVSIRRAAASTATPFVTGLTNPTGLLLDTSGTLFWANGDGTIRAAAAPP
jgi:hypothetical protein